MMSLGAVALSTGLCISVDESLSCKPGNDFPRNLSYATHVASSTSRQQQLFLPNERQEEAGATGGEQRQPL